MNENVHAGFILSAQIKSFFFLNELFVSLKKKKSFWNGLISLVFE